MFSWLLSCCGRRRKQQHDPEAVPNERTPIIPATEDTPIAQLRIVDHQRLKERLGSVLKSKETKMVNVNAQFPFNLHNQRLEEPSPSRSSRNVSGGTYGSSRHASLSPHPSLKKSRSCASIHHDGEDLSSSQFLAPIGNRPQAILNVRLIKAGKAAGAQGPTNDRGRMLRHGELPVISGMGSEDGLPRGSDDATQESTNRDNWATPAHPQPSLSAQGPPPQEVLIDLALDQNVVDIPRSPESFTIHDAGAVSRSWRD